MVKLVQNSFLGGQLDYELMGRQDMSRYSKGASRLVNFNILRRGGICKRQGFDRICSLGEAFVENGQPATIAPDAKVRIIPYAHTKEQGFVLVLVSGKMRAIRSDPTKVWETYEIGGYDGRYVGSEIDELDYQQCGDVIFFAHQNHPPAKVEHYVGSAGTHFFLFTQLEMNAMASGVPSLGAPVVSGNRDTTDEEEGYTPATKTESYKATAVFADGETLPSGEATTGAYKLPWSQGQTVTVTANVRSRAGDGAAAFPEEIRFYKKAFNYYGLIGSKKVSHQDVGLSWRYPDDDTKQATRYYSSAGTLEIFDGSLAETADFGIGRRHLYVLGEDDDEMHVHLSSANSGGAVRILLGGLVSSYSATTGTLLFFYPNLATSIVVGGALAKKDGSSWVDRTIALDRSDYEGKTTSGRVLILQVQKRTGEQDEEFQRRSDAEVDAAVRKITDQRSVTIPIDPTNAKDFFTVKAVGGNLRMNGVLSAKPSPSSVSFTDNNIVPDSSVTPFESLDPSLFSGYGNYPASVSLTQQRLVWASSRNDPARIWMSQVGDFYTYTPHEIQVPDDAIDFVVPVTRFPRINHIVEMRKLLMFNSACEWMVDSASSVSGITYETIQAYPQSYSGSSVRLKPIVCNNSVVFCERTGQSVRRFAWDLAADGFAGRDVSVLSSSIFENNNIVDWTYQQFPLSTLWCVLADGRAASFEYMEEQEIIAWATHVHGGGRFKCFATSYGLSSAIDEIGNAEALGTATHEEVFAVVQHGYVDGNGAWQPTELAIERMRVRSKPRDSVYHALCMDSVRVLNGYRAGGVVEGTIPVPMDAHWVSGTGQHSVYTWGDEPQFAGLRYVASDTEDGEYISREEALRRLLDPDDDVTIYEGYPYNADFMSVFPAIAMRTIGAGQFDIKDIGNVGLRLMASHGGTVRAEGCDEPEPIRYEDDPGALKNARFNGEGMPAGTVEFFDLDAANVKPVGINVRDGRFHVEQDKPWPFAVLMYEVDIEAEVGRGGY